MEAEEYFGSELGVDIWTNKYQNGDESFDGWLDRVSGGDKQVRELIEQKKFMFAGRILANRGIDGRKTSLSNCYVIKPPEDNLESIYQTASELARTFSYGGGCGIDLSELSPRGASINNAAKTTSGAVSFAELYNKTTELIGQYNRRGALMLTLSSEHPDIEEFIDAKTNSDKLTKANLSVRVGDEFMQAACDGTECVNTFVRNPHEHNLNVTHTSTIVKDCTVIHKTISPSKLLKKLAQNNHDWSDPGMVYWDEIEHWNMISEIEDFVYAGLNPCGEQPLPAGGACLLGSINLSEFVVDDTFDWYEFRRCIHTSVIALNDVLDEGIERHALQTQSDAAEKWRQIGLGVMGYADCLIKLGHTYGEYSANEFTERIAHVMIEEAALESTMLADEHGMFHGCDPTKILESEFVQENLSEHAKDRILGHGLRNATLLSIAPTGSISTMLGISGGIEPHYALSYKRKTESLHGEDVYYDVNVQIAQEYIDSNGTDVLPDYFITAKEIDWKDRIEVQGIWQEYIDASISSTINLPCDATVDDVEQIYIKAWERGLKGVTVHRDCNKRVGVLSEQLGTETSNELERGEWQQLSDNVIGKKIKVYTGCGRITMHVYYNPITKRIEELWIDRSGNGGCERSLTSIGVLMSGMIRLGGNLDNIKRAISGIGGCNSFSNAHVRGTEVSPGKHCADAMLRKLIEFEDGLSGESTVSTEDMVDDFIPLDTYIETINVCPDCGTEMIASGSCYTCQNCGFSRCD